MLGFARRKKKDTFASNITIVVREYTPNPDETLHVSYQAQSSKSITYDFDESGDQDYVTCFDVKYELKRMGGYFERAKNDRVFQLFVVCSLCLTYSAHSHKVVANYNNSKRNLGRRETLEIQSFMTLQRFLHTNMIMRLHLTLTQFKT